MESMSIMRVDSGKMETMRMIQWKGGVFKAA